MQTSQAFIHDLIPSYHCPAYAFNTLSLIHTSLSWSLTSLLKACLDHVIPYVAQNLQFSNYIRNSGCLVMGTQSNTSKSQENWDKQYHQCNSIIITRPVTMKGRYRTAYNTGQQCLMIMKYFEIWKLQSE